MDLTADSAITQLDERVREVLSSCGRLSVDVSALRDHDDLFESGLSSHANIAVLLALEEEFGVEFPDRLLRKTTFESVSSIRGAISELLAATVTA